MLEKLQNNTEVMGEERMREIRDVFAQMAIIAAGHELAAEESQLFHDHTGNVVLGYN